MDQYSVLKVIGEGSFGRALLVQSNTDKEKHVLKEIRLPKCISHIQPDLQSKCHNAKVECRMKRVHREAILLSRMKHPNIVRFRESFEEDGHLCIVMEFCSGGDLLQKIQLQKNCLFTEDVILMWFTQMCLGMEHIHDKRVLHRDLKSKNIFLSDHGTIKLGDFGSACLLNSAKGYAQSYVGTPYYVSPEIWDSRPYNNKSDIWSLGCVLYELCTLHHPFQARSWKSLILKVCRGAYAPLPSHLPYELHYLIKHMFKTNPKDRPSIHTILNSHRVSRLLHKHIPEKDKHDTQSKEKMKKPVNHWRKEEGEKVAMFLAQKSLLTTSTTEDTFSSKPSQMECKSGDLGPRKRWVEGPSNTVLQVLRNADIISSGGMAATESSGSVSGAVEVYMDVQKKRERRKWNKDPPKRLLSLLEKFPLNTAFQTYTIHKASAVEQSADAPDGQQGVHTDQSRLDPRSDDEDTDFEEDLQCDWVAELEKMAEAQ